MPVRLESVAPFFKQNGAKVWYPAEMRIIHAQRARKLRRRGELVELSEFKTKNGAQVFMWFVIPRDNSADTFDPDIERDIYEED
jgi:hypothetical protein